MAEFLSEIALVGQFHFQFMFGQTIDSAVNELKMIDLLTGHEYVPVRSIMQCHIHPSRLQAMCIRKKATFAKGIAQVKDRAETVIYITGTEVNIRFPASGVPQVIFK
ncbi:hypothetical protein D3C87_1366950 [compost metagenome]